ncbi:MAG: hypothetical protein ACREAL_04155 [Nitrosopumilaceae archaeon]
MITKEDILQIIQTRDEKLLNWLKKNPKKHSLLILKKTYKDLWEEVLESLRFSKENNPKFPAGDLGFVYLFMNEFSALFTHHIVARIYIKKLEKELLELKRKTQVNSSKI